MTEQPTKRGRGAPRKGRDLQRNVTRSFSPLLLQALQDVTDNQSEFMESWLWQHPRLIEWSTQHK